jgi:hypothetical protein
MLDFPGSWTVGISSISYTYSWDNLGTLNSQWIEFHIRGISKSIRVPVPKASYSSTEALEDGLIKSILDGIETYFNLRDEHLKKSSNVSRKRREVDQPIENPEIVIEEPKEPPSSLTKTLGDFTKNVAINYPSTIRPIVLPIIHRLEVEDAQIIKEPQPLQNPEITPEEPDEPDPEFGGKSYGKKAEITVGRNISDNSEIGVELQISEYTDSFEGENYSFPSSVSNKNILHFIEGLRLTCIEGINKFKFEFEEGHWLNSFVSHITLSPQLGYLLGFENPDIVMIGETAKYSADLKGGIDAFGVYAKGLTENIICGGELVSLLRVVTLKGNPQFGDKLEEIYNPPMYLRVLPRQVSEIDIELRAMSMDGRLMPFHFGVTRIVLLFKKVINF